MALGKLNECWVCYESKYYKARTLGKSFSQVCTPVRGKPHTIVERMAIWLCSECKTRFKE